MPRNYSSGSKYSKRPASKKVTTKAASKYAKAAKSAKRKVVAAKRSRPGSTSVKKLVLANAKAVAKLKVEKYGPIQTNTSTTKDSKPLAVTDQRPMCVHMNNLYSTIHSPKVIRGKYQHFGDITNVMNDYGIMADFHKRVPQHMGLQNEVCDEPSGKELLWLSTRFDIKVQGWCERTVLNFYIVKQKIGKVNSNYDPWDTLEVSPKPSYLPYTLPQFRETAGPWATNSIDPKMYTILKKKSCYINSIGESPPLSAQAQVGHAVAAVFVDNAHDGGNHLAKMPTTAGEKYVSITYSPNQVLKMLRDPFDSDGEIMHDYKADPKEDKVHSNWGYNNQDPSKNVFLIITSSDPEISSLGGDTSSHETTVVIRRTNKWRDLADESHVFAH